MLMVGTDENGENEEHRGDGARQVRVLEVIGLCLDSRILKVFSTSKGSMMSVEGTLKMLEMTNMVGMDEQGGVSGGNGNPKCGGD